MLLVVSKIVIIPKVDDWWKKDEHLSLFHKVMMNISEYIKHYYCSNQVDSSYMSWIYSVFTSNNKTMSVYKNIYTTLLYTCLLLSTGEAIWFKILAMAVYLAQYYLRW